MVIDFKEIQRFIPGFVFNEYGQLTGNYVRYEDVFCVAENGRIQVWLNHDAYDAKDPDRLICDYEEKTIRKLIADQIV
ncbi:MAG TPA: hypothetical protein VI756_00410 [Blastocatellia bacterium]